jgi:hypothetical protein
MVVPFQIGGVTFEHVGGDAAERVRTGSVDELRMCTSRLRGQATAAAGSVAHGSAPRRPPSCARFAVAVGAAMAMAMAMAIAVADLVDLKFDDAAFVSVTGLVRAVLEPALDDDPLPALQASPRHSRPVRAADHGDGGVACHGDLLRCW